MLVFYTFSQVKHAFTPEAAEFTLFLKTLRKTDALTTFILACNQSCNSSFPSLSGDKNGSICYSSISRKSYNLLFFFDTICCEHFVLVQNTSFVSAIYFPDKNVFLYGSKGESYYRGILEDEEEDIGGRMRGFSSEDRYDYFLINGYPRPYHYFYDITPTIIESLLSNGKIKIATKKELAFLSGKELTSMVGGGVSYDYEDVVRRKESVMILPGQVVKKDAEEKIAPLKKFILGGCFSSSRRRYGVVNLWIGLCSEKRFLLNFYEVIDFLINEFSGRGRLVVFCDGLTSPSGYETSLFRNMFCDEEIKVYKKLLNLYPDVSFVDLVGAKAGEKIKAASRIDYFFSNALTDSMWCSAFFDKKGIVYCSPRAELKYHLHNSSNVVFSKQGSANQGDNYSHDSVYLDLQDVRAALE